MSNWSNWLSFPDPKNSDYICAPFGPGVYELRHRSSGQLILFGSGKNVAYRMTSLLPPPLGQGTRKNETKRQYVLNHMADIEYRTLPCASKEEAKQQESQLKNSRMHLFST